VAAAAAYYGAGPVPRQLLHAPQHHRAHQLHPLHQSNHLLHHADSLANYAATGDDSVQETAGLYCSADRGGGGADQYYSQYYAPPPPPRAAVKLRVDVDRM